MTSKSQTSSLYLKSLYFLQQSIISQSIFIFESLKVLILFHFSLYFVIHFFHEIDLIRFETITKLVTTVITSLLLLTLFFRLILSNCKYRLITVLFCFHGAFFWIDYNSQVQDNKRHLFFIDFAFSFVLLQGFFYCINLYRNQLFKTLQVH